MPREVDKRVDAIIESCMEEGDQTRDECESMAYAIVNSDKAEEKTTENSKEKA